MYLELRGRGSWSLTELRTGKGRVERPCCCTGSWGLEGERGCREGRGEQRGEMYELQQLRCGALGNVGPPQECSNPLLPLYPLSFTKINSLLLQTAINNATIKIMW